MRRLLKWLASFILLALLLLGGAVAYVVLYLDPNAYRPQIEALAKQRGVDLSIRGNLSWTLWPRLGIEVQDLTAAAPASGLPEPAQVESFSVFVQLLPLLRKQVLIDGVDINNVAWKYQTGPRQISVNKLVLRARDVNFDNNTFPFTVSTVIEMTNPLVTAEITAQTVLALDTASQHIRIDDVDIKTKLVGATFGDRSPEVGIKVQGDIDLEKHVMQIARLALHLDNHRLSFTGDVSQLNTAPQIKGELAAEIAGINALLTTFSMSPITTRDADVLQTLTLKSKVNGDAHKVQLDDLAVTLDSTTLTGNATWQGGEIARIDAKLDGTTLDVDRYRAVHKDSTTPKTPASDGAGVSAAEQEVQLLPLLALRNINGRFDLSFAELRLSGLTFGKLSTTVTADVGNIVVKHFNADFYAGKLAIAANVDARDNAPLISIKPTLRDVQLVPLLKAIAPERKDKVMVSDGTLTLTGDITTHGITRGDITRALNGTLEFSADNVVVDNVNIDREACQAASKVANKPLPAIQWASNTAVKHFTGHANIVNGVIQNDVLQAQRDAASLRGVGEIVLLEEKYNYQLDVKLTGRGSPQFCSSISDRWVDVEWPVACTGAFGGAPQCGVDKKRMADLAKQLAKGETQKKLEDKIDQKIGGKEGEAVKGLLKGLLN